MRIGIRKGGVNETETIGLQEEFDSITSGRNNRVSFVVPTMESSNSPKLKLKLIGIRLAFCICHHLLNCF